MKVITNWKMIGFLKSRNSVSFFYTIVVEVPCEGILCAVESGVLNVIPFPLGLWPSDISLTHMILLLSSIEQNLHFSSTTFNRPQSPLLSAIASRIGSRRYGVDVWSIELFLGVPIPPFPSLPLRNPPNNVQHLAGPPPLTCICHPSNQK